MFRLAGVLVPTALGCGIWEKCYGPASKDWPEDAPKEEDTRCCGTGRCSSANATHPMLGCGAWEACFYEKCCGTGKCHTPAPPPPPPAPTPVPPFPDPLPGAGHHWAVIVAGSNTYSNYRHQADACHAYQIMKAKGVPEDQIILMAYDDIANSKSNPFPGKIFNKPDPHGDGIDVYAGCNIDYKGSAVTPQNFMDVLTGTASGKALKSTSEDNVFVYFADHGAPGLIAFPSRAGELHKTQLQSTLQTMSDNQMFKKLTFYLESCESGSMFEDMNISGVYAISAANPTESSWGSYCGSEANVNGKGIGSCLGDLFSVNWMEDSDAMDTTQESLDTQFQTVKTKTNKSEVMQWGDISYTGDKVSEFVGGLTPSTTEASKDSSASAVSARQMDLHRLYFLYKAATTSAERLLVGEELRVELARQMAVDTVHNRFLALMYPGDEAKQQAMRDAKSKPNNFACEMSVHEALREHAADQFYANSGFAMQFHQWIVNVCADMAMANGSISSVVDAAKAACNSDMLV